MMWPFSGDICTERDMTNSYSQSLPNIYVYIHTIPKANTIIIIFYAAVSSLHVTTSISSCKWKLYQPTATFAFK
ncbi:unnamed protein product [Rotaria socialis]